MFLQQQSYLFYTPFAFDAQYGGGGGARRNTAIPFGKQKLEWCGYPVVKKENMSSRFDRIQACDRWTDRDTLRQHSPRYA